MTPPDAGRRSSSRVVRGLVVAHADLAQALVRTVERISGIAGALEPVSNDGLGAEALRERLQGEIDDDPIIIFVDLAAGSCGMAGLGTAKGREGVAVVTGANVPMLLDFVFNRERPLDELVARVVDRAHAGIRGYGCDPDPGGPGPATDG
jgi:mannose/fructose-specific phosphotransferase system component IIA